MTDIDNIVNDDVWVVPKLNHDENRDVGPVISRGWIRRSAGDSYPEHTRFYARQLLAAADELERRNKVGSTGCGFTPHGWPCCGLAPIGLAPSMKAKCGGPGMCRDCRVAVEANCAQAVSA